MNGAEGMVKITVFVVRSTPSEGGAEYVHEAAAELQQTRANALFTASSDDSAEHALGELELCPPGAKMKCGTRRQRGRGHKR